MFRILRATTAVGALVALVERAHASYLEAQSIGLEALFNATGGEQWISSTGWQDPSLGICNWYGVACDGSGQNVTDLSLSGNGLVGNLTKAVGFFDMLSLVSVDLSDNGLIGPVALGFGAMPNLVVLDLSKNELSSFPASWGANASSLRHLSLQDNNISGELPSAWLGVSSSTSFPVIHTEEIHPWLPELRTLAVGSNAITMPVYLALQAVIGFASLQVLDFSGNVLSGSMDQSFDLHFCDAAGSDPCESTVVKTGASAMAIVLLASNLIDGELEAISLPKSLSVLTVSANLLHGPVPEGYSQLAVFMAEGNAGLNNSALPSFASYDNSSDVITRRDNLSCPVISGQHAGGRSMRLGLDPSYLTYSHCVCIQGMEGNFQDGCQPCPEGTYRGTAELFTTSFCVACPANSRSTNTGAESVSQCKCEAGFYDTLAGAGDGDPAGAPSCSACPHGSIGWDDPGAISIAACACPAGQYLDETAEACAECEAGTYKTSVGNDANLCVPCAKGTYSSRAGGTSSDVCIPCEAGTYSASSGAAAPSVCLPCPRGTYSSKSGLFTADLCSSCPAGYYSEDEAGATDADVCVPCAQGTSSSEIDSCEPCPDGLSSLRGSYECELELANSRRWLAIYLAVGASTLTAICVAYYTWQRKVHKKKKLMVDSRTDTPLKMTGAKRKAHMWAVFFHTLEAIDVITASEPLFGNALFAYLLDIGDIQGFMQYIYWLVVSLGLALNVFRIYMIVWMRWLVNVSVAEKVDKEGKKALVVYMPGNRYLPERQRSDRRIMTPDDAKMVLELVKILKHLQINKFKVQLAVVMDLPLTILNLWLLWMVDPDLIKSALFLTSLIIAVFSAGKISTLIEYHLELRQRKRKLERLLLLELKSSKAGDEDDITAEESNIDHQEASTRCFEHGHPETLLKFHGKSMRNIATTEAEDPPLLPRRRDRIRYLKLSPTRRSPKDRFKRKPRGAGNDRVGGGADADGSIPGRPVGKSVSPKRSRLAAAAGYATIPQDEEDID
ncbi:unnamed protein product [Scytosiphon promiscuus]